MTQAINISLKHPSGNQCLLFLMLFACFFLLPGCYENSDDTTTDTTEVEFPKVTNDGFLIGNVVENGELVGDYTLEINNEEFQVLSQFYLDLKRVNKLFQPISVFKSGELIGFAVTPILQDEVNLIEIETFTRSETHPINQSEFSFEISPQLTLTIDGSEPENEGLTSIDFHLLQDNIGCSGTQENVLRFALNHLDAFILDSDENTLHGELSYAGYSLSENLGLFRLDDETSDWLLIKTIDQTQGSLTIETDGIYSIAEYVSGVIVEGEVTHDGQPLGFLEFNVFNFGDNPSCTHQTTGSGKYLSFVKQDATVNIGLNTCDNYSDESLTTMESDRANVNIEYQNFDGSSIFTLNPQLVDCSTSQINTASVQLISQDQTSLPLPSNTEVAVVGCEAREYNIAVDLEDGTQFTLPWNAEIDDPYLFLPNCPGAIDGYGYIKINGETKYYETFVRDNSISEEIQLSSVDGEFQILLKDNQIGNYETNQVGLIIEDSGFGSAGYAVDCGLSQQGCGLDYCQVTHLDSEWLRVSFSGTVWMQTLQTLNAGNYPVEGNIVIKL